ncbi:hypothetical protein ABZS86_25945 [Streptomyces sp. NPDC005355]
MTAGGVRGNSTAISGTATAITVATMRHGPAERAAELPSCRAAELP